MADTTYKTGLEFTVGGNAEQAIGRISGAADRLVGRMNNATRSMVAFGAGAVGLGLGFRALGHQVIEANTELEKIQKQVTGTLLSFQTWRKGTTTMQAYTQSVEDAEEVTALLEGTEERLAMNLPDIAAGYNMLAGPVIGRLGKSRQDLMMLTNDVANAAVVFQQAPAQVAQAMARILETGKLPERSVDPFVVHMRQALGKIKGMDRGKLFQKMKDEMEHLGPVAEKMATGFTAQWFRLKDFVGDTVRDLGSPVFKYVADQAERLRKFLGQQVGEGKTLGQLYGEKILKGFQTLEDVAKRVLGHWKEFAAIWAGMKLGQGLGGLAGMFGGGGVGQQAGGIAGFVGKLSNATAALGLFAVGLQTAVIWLEKRQDEEIQRRGRAEGIASVVASSIGKGNLTGAYRVLQKEGLVSGDTVNQAELRKVFAQSGKEMSAALKSLGFGTDIATVKQLAPLRFTGKGLDLEGFLAKTVADRIKSMPQVPPTLAGAMKPELAVKGKVIQNFYGGIKIEQDFKDQDPDRIWVSFKEGLEKQADRRLQSTTADPFSM